MDIKYEDGRGKIFFEVFGRFWYRLAERFATLKAELEKQILGAEVIWL
jgi:hypothetical protein